MMSYVLSCGLQLCYRSGHPDALLPTIVIRRHEDQTKTFVPCLQLPTYEHTDEAGIKTRLSHLPSQK